MFINFFVDIYVQKFLSVRTRSLLIYIYMRIIYNYQKYDILLIINKNNYISIIL